MAPLFGRDNEPPGEPVLIGLWVIMRAVTTMLVVVGGVTVAGWMTGDPIALTGQDYAAFGALGLVAATVDTIRRRTPSRR